MLKKHHEVLLCDDAASALILLSNRTIDFVIAEPLESLEFIRKAQEVSPKTSVLLMAPHQAADQANVLERLLVLAPSSPPQTETPGDLNATLEALEYRILQETLAVHHYNQVKAAEALGITRGALQYKMKKYHLADEDKKAA